MKIIEVTENEIDGIMDLNNEVQEMHIKWYPAKYKTLNKNKLKEFLKKLIGRKDTIFFAAKENCQIVGYIKLVIFNIERDVFFHNHSFIEIDQISVAQRARGRGIGRVLINKAKQIAQSHGINKLTLTVKSKNINAIKTYEALGFEKTSEKMELDLNT